MGVTVVKNQHGYLRFRIFWKGRDVAVSTRFRDDDPAGRNSRLVNAKAILIEEKLRTGADLHRALLEVPAIVRPASCRHPPLLLEPEQCETIMRNGSQEGSR